jgi:hypothetical protein
MRQSYGHDMATLRDAAVRLAELGIEAANAYGRADLAERLAESRRAAAEPTVRVLVAGEFKQGKSSLVNALVGHDVCPVDDDIATSVATAVRYAAAPEAVAVVADDDGSTHRRTIDPDALPAWVSEDGAMAATDGLRLVEVGVPAPLLRNGLVLIDLPGAGGLGSFHGAATLAGLRYAHGVLFASDAMQELFAAERNFLDAVAARCAVVALVKTRTDIHPAWRRIVDADRGHAQGRAAFVHGVSAALAQKSRESDDDELLAESGLPELAAWLRTDVVAGVSRRQARSVASEVDDVCRQVRDAFTAEHAALSEHVDRARLEANLQRANDDAERLRDAASTWQQVLGDAFSDIGSDIDYSLRVRVRDLGRRCEETIDTFDPARGWEEYEPALRREVSTVVADHYAELGERIEAAAQQVAAVFGDGAAAIADALRVGVPVAERPGAELRDAARMGVGGQALMLLRGSYGPAIMFSFLGGVVGLTIAAPALLAIGMVMGGKGLRTEKQRQLAARRAQAKSAARHFVDGVVFEVSKDTRDQMKHAQRTLRDHFSRRADELSRSAAAALHAARSAAGRDDHARAQRRDDIEAELERLDWLARMAAVVGSAGEDAT